MRRSLSEIVYLSVCKIKTILFYRNARLIRFPIDIRGRDGILFGKQLTTGKYCRIETFSGKNKSLVFGNNIQINDFVHIASKASVTIGNNVLIASKVFITDLQHGSYLGDSLDSSPYEIAEKRKLSSKPVRIHDNVWIGEMVVILPGVNIGENSIIGASSVVTKSIPANCIAVGNPAKVIKTYNFSTNKWERI